MSLWIYKHILPAGATPTIQASCTCQTAAGAFNSNCAVCLVNIILPGYRNTCTVDFQTAHVFSTTCRYDFLGRDFLRNVGLKLDFGTNSMEWFPVVRPMQPSSLVSGTTPSQLREALFIDIMAMNTLDVDDKDELFASSAMIKDTNYYAVDVA
jgi:hypothetical protein